MPTAARDPHDQLATAERRAKVLALRLAGTQFIEIGRLLDPPVTGPRAYAIYREALKDIVREPGEQLVTTELARLDLLWEATMPAALGGSVSHILTALRILQRRARMLGLDAPTKTEVRMTIEEVDQLDREIEGLIAEWDGRGSGGRELDGNGDRAPGPGAD